MNWPRLAPRQEEAARPEQEGAGQPLQLEREPKRLRLVERSSSRRSHETGSDRGTLLGDNRAYILRRLLALSDLCALVVAGFGAAAIQFLVRQELPAGTDIAMFVIFVPLWLVLASLVGLYHLSDRRLDHSAADEFGPLAVALTAWNWFFLVGRTIAETSPTQELPSVALWFLGILALLAGRAITRGLARRQPWYRQRVAVIGSRHDMAQVIRRIDRHPEFGLDIVRTWEVGGNGDRGANADGLRLGPIWTARGLDIPELATGGPQVPDAEEITTLVTTYGINRVIVATHTGDMDERSELLRALSCEGVHVDVISGEPEAFSANTVLHYVEGMPVLTIPAAGTPRIWGAAKRCFDIAASAAGLVLLSPFIAYCAIRIKLGTPGPVLFRQQRIGRKGRNFELVKFRTMVVDADARKREISDLNIHADTDTPGMFKVPDDPRITRFGAKLRRWSLDELPQLWNVLKGDMSLVGPRPLIPEEALVVEAHYKERLRVRPGITGPWQALGRSDIGFGDMVKLDYAYVTNWSFSEDLRLLVRTLGAITNGRGAY